MDVVNAMLTKIMKMMRWSCDFTMSDDKKIVEERTETYPDITITMHENEGLQMFWEYFCL